MKSVFAPLRSISPLAVLLLAGLALAVGCKGGGGGGRIERVCEDYCHRAVVECLEIDRAEDDCVDVCIDDVEEAEDLDGDDCADAQLDAFACVADLVDCDDVFDFTDLTDADLPTPFCTAEVNSAVNLCQESIDIEI